MFLNCIKRWRRRRMLRRKNQKNQKMKETIKTNRRLSPSILLTYNTWRRLKAGYTSILRHASANESVATFTLRIHLSKQVSSDIIHKTHKLKHLKTQTYPVGTSVSSRRPLDTHWGPHRGYTPPNRVLQYPCIFKWSTGEWRQWQTGEDSSHCQEDLPSRPRQMERLEACKNTLINWCATTWASKYRHCTWGPTTLLPDSVLTKLAKCARIKMVADMKIELPEWPFVDNHGNEIIKLLEPIDSAWHDKKEQKKAKAKAKRAGKPHRGKHSDMRNDWQRNTRKLLIKQLLLQRLRTCRLHPRCQAWWVLFLFRIPLLVVLLSFTFILTLPCPLQIPKPQLPDGNSTFYCSQCQPLVNVELILFMIHHLITCGNLTGFEPISIRSFTLSFASNFLPGFCEWIFEAWYDICSQTMSSSLSSEVCDLPRWKWLILFLTWSFTFHWQGIEADILPMLSQSAYGPTAAKVCFTDPSQRDSKHRNITYLDVTNIVFLQEVKW